MTTLARTTTDRSAHFYLPDGTPLYEVPYADPSKGFRKATLSDARKVGAFPGVTTILKVLDQPDLNTWKTEQAVLAVLSTPRMPNEKLDQFVHRVLHEEKVQEEEARKARETGNQIHKALSLALMDQQWDHSLESYVTPVVEWVKFNGKIVWTEKVLVGDGYAGRADLLIDNGILNSLLLTDFKTCGKLPTKDSWLEHKLQTAAYAKTIGNTGDKRIITCNVYLSTKEPGKYAVFTQDEWQETYACGFRPILDYWRWANKYYPGGNL